MHNNNNNSVMTRSRCHVVFVAFVIGVVVGAFLVYSFTGRVHTEPLVYRSRPSQLNGPLPRDAPSKPLRGPVQRRVGPLSRVEVMVTPKPKPPPVKPRVIPTVPSIPKLRAYAKTLSTSSSYTEVEDAYYGRLESVHVKCTPVPHVGRDGDGGWEVCMAPAFKPTRPCTVYSFGVNNIWEFDEAMARDYGCTVRAFDPSMSASDHVHTPGPVHFYKLGLGGKNRKLSNGWHLFTFGEFLARFGDSRKVIDLVKIDIEFSEWESFEKMLTTDIFSRIKQLIFETHINDLNGVVTTIEEYLRYHRILDGIESFGFRRYFRHSNPFGIGPVTGTRSHVSDPALRKSADLRRTCCHELYYINMKYATDMTGIELV